MDVWSTNREPFLWTLKGSLVANLLTPFSLLTFEGEEIASISFLSVNFKIKIRQQNQYAEPKKSFKLSLKDRLEGFFFQMCC